MVEVRTTVAIAFAACCTAAGGVAAGRTLLFDDGPTGARTAAISDTARRTQATVTVVQEQIVEDTILVPVGTPPIPWGCEDPELVTGGWRCAN